MTAPALLENVTEALEKIANEIGLSARRSLEAAIETGSRLEAARRLIPHGEWYNWLDQQRKLYRLSDEDRQRFGIVSRGFLISNKTADNYRAVARAAEAIIGTDLEAVFMALAAGDLYGELSIRDMDKAESLYSYVKQAVARITAEDEITALPAIKAMLQGGQISKEAAAEIDRRTSLASPAVQNVVGRWGVRSEDQIDYLSRFERNAPEVFTEIAASGMLPSALDQPIALKTATVTVTAQAYKETMIEIGKQDQAGRLKVFLSAAPVNSLFVSPDRGHSSVTATVAIDSDLADKIAEARKAGLEFRLSLTAIPKQNS